MKTIFCANCQEEKPHTITVENEEVIFTCECARFIKLPASMTKKEIEKYLKAHKENNQGQISAEKYKEAEDRLVSLLSD